MLMKNLFSEVLRILTPDELTVLTIVSEGDQFLSLNEMMEEEFVIARLRSPRKKAAEDDGKAKILPFVAAEKPAIKEPERVKVSLPLPEERKSDAEALAKDVAEEIKAGAIKMEDLGELRNLEETSPVSKQEDNVVDLGDFIIREKQRLKESQKRLKEQEVVGLYKRSASVDLEQEKLIKGDLSKSVNGGILVNKKQL